MRTRGLALCFCHNEQVMSWRARLFDDCKDLLLLGILKAVAVRMCFEELYY